MSDLSWVKFRSLVGRYGKVGFASLVILVRLKEREWTGKEKWVMENGNHHRRLFCLFLLIVFSMIPRSAMTPAPINTKKPKNLKNNRVRLR